MAEMGWGGGRGGSLPGPRTATVEGLGVPGKTAIPHDEQVPERVDVLRESHRIPQPRISQAAGFQKSLAVSNVAR